MAPAAPVTGPAPGFQPPRPGERESSSRRPNQSTTGRGIARRNCAARFGTVTTWGPAPVGFDLRAGGPKAQPLGRSVDRCNENLGRSLRRIPFNIVQQGVHEAAPPDLTLSFSVLYCRPYSRLLTRGLSLVAGISSQPLCIPGLGTMHVGALRCTYAQVCTAAR